MRRAALRRVLAVVQADAENARPARLGASSFFTSAFVGGHAMFAEDVALEQQHRAIVLQRAIADEVQVILEADDFRRAHCFRDARRGVKSLAGVLIRDS